MSEKHSSRLLIPFPFRVPRHPAGEPLPEASEQFSFQIRSCVDVPGVDDAIVACIPDGIGGWEWVTWGGDEPTPDPRTELVLTFSPAPDVSFSGGLVWTDMPLAQTEFRGFQQNRIRADITGFSQVRLHADMIVAGSTNAILDLQYSTNIGAPSFTDMNIDTNISATGWRTSGWFTIPVGARTDVILRVVGQSGDGVADPDFRTVYAEFG